MFPLFKMILMLTQLSKTLKKELKTVESKLSKLKRKVTFSTTKLEQPSRPLLSFSSEEHQHFNKELEQINQRLDDNLFIKIRKNVFNQTELTPQAKKELKKIECKISQLKTPEIPQRTLKVDKIPLSVIDRSGEERQKIERELQGINQLLTESSEKEGLFARIRRQVMGKREPVVAGKNIHDLKIDELDKKILALKQEIHEEVKQK